MKKITTLMAILVTVTGTAFGNGDEKVEKKANKSDQIALLNGGNKTYRLIYPFKDRGMVDIEIKDAEGHVVASDEVYNTKGFLRRYDMHPLKDGDYVIELSTKNETLVKPFKVENNSKFAVLSQQEDKYQLLVELEAKNDITVLILDANNKMIHKETHADTKGFSRTYDLESVDTDEFTFKISGQGYKQEIKIDKN